MMVGELVNIVRPKCVQRIAGVELKTQMPAIVLSAHSSPPNVFESFTRLQQHFTHVVTYQVLAVCAASTYVRHLHGIFTEILAMTVSSPKRILRFRGFEDCMQRACDCSFHSSRVVLSIRVLLCTGSRPSINSRMNSQGCGLLSLTTAWTAHDHMVSSILTPFCAPRTLSLCLALLFSLTNIDLRVELAVKELRNERDKMGDTDVSSEGLKGARIRSFCTLSSVSVV